MASSARIIDSHQHLGSVDQVDRVIDIADNVGLERVNIVCCVNPTRVNANPPALVCKDRYPERVSVFVGLDHTGGGLGAQTGGPTLAEQVDRAVAMGADGFKLIEGKPTARRWLNVPLDDEYFEPFFQRAAERGMGLIWHVADPETFWDPQRLPFWAAEHGWGYDNSDVSKETLYAEVERVLGRHPDLRVIFAHFFFLSADLPRAAAFLERFENACFDLTPGFEMYYNMSADPQAARELFDRFGDRIVFGTDVTPGASDDRARAIPEIMCRWLGTTDEFRVPEVLAGSEDKMPDPVLRGIGLSADALERIYRTNFERLSGPSPRPLDRALAADECRRIASSAPDPSQAARAAEILSG